MAQIHWDSLIQIRPNTTGELAKVTPFGRLSLTQTILEKFPDRMLGGRKTVICEFLGTGMISVMPVPLLSVHPREYSQQGHIRYVPSAYACRWTCRVLPHKPPLQAL